MCHVCEEIVELMNGEWDEETLDEVANILTNAGHNILTIEEKEEEDNA